MASHHNDRIEDFLDGPQEFDLCRFSLIQAFRKHGDPDNPINRGVLDPKSLATRQLSTSPLRLGKVMYRAAGSDKWEEKSWDWAISEIAKRIKQTRDETFVRTVKVGDKDVTVNRTEGIAWLGGAANNSEDCYLGTKFSRALGLAYLEHQARI